jgi:hypothetical protein
MLAIKAGADWCPVLICILGYISKKGCYSMRCSCNYDFNDSTGIQLQATPPRLSALDSGQQDRFIYATPQFKVHFY